MVLPLGGHGQPSPEMENEIQSVALVRKEVRNATVYYVV